MAKPISRSLAPLLLIADAALAAWNWYLQPVALGSSLATALIVALLLLGFAFVTRGTTTEAAYSRRENLWTGIISGALLVAVALAVKIGLRLGLVGSADLGQRTSMAIIGAMLVFIGNSIPKTLRPLSATSCDPAKVQARQRVSGWTWVLAGLAVIAAWLTLPMSLASTATFVIVPSALVIAATQVIHLRRMKSRTA